MSEPILHLVSTLCEDLDSPQSREVRSLIAAGDFGSLVKLKTDPSRYVRSSDYLRDAAATSILRKCAGLQTGINTAEVAKAGFFTAERQCYKTNRRLEQLLHDAREGTSELRIVQFLDDVKKLISVWLGPLPRELSMARFGPGATLEDRGRLTTIPDKLSSRPTSTYAARALLPMWWQTAWARSLVSGYSYRSDPKTVKGNRFTTVPKDATKDRGIAIEPSINVFFQLGVGKVLRNRLKRIGIDLEEGQSLHRAAARTASVSRRYATIDLSSASDTVATRLVQWVLPQPWLDLLDSLRSPMTNVDGVWHLLEKFSSMGNGFTFELETLIFAAIATVASRQVCDKVEIGVDILVYGDDIIVPSESTQEVLAALRFCGFTPNSEKTFFAESPFRESCGGDYFKGADVRPHFLKELPYEPQHWIALANGLRRLGHRLGGFGPHNPVWRSWRLALDQIPRPIRDCRGPAELGDVVIHDDQIKWRVRVSDSIRYLKAYVPVTRPVPLYHWLPDIQLAAALYGVPSDGPRPRGSVSGYKVKELAYS